MDQTVVYAWSAEVPIIAVTFATIAWSIQRNRRRRYSASALFIFVFATLNTVRWCGIARYASSTVIAGAACAWALMVAAARTTRNGTIRRRILISRRS